jgi:hypothetical protein
MGVVVGSDHLLGVEQLSEHKIGYTLFIQFKKNKIIICVVGPVRK